MKVKLKFDLASIKNWLLAHGEKLALGVVGILVLIFIYGAARREVLDTSKHGPDKLQELASAVTNHVAKSDWNENPDRQTIQDVDYTERAKSKAVDPAAFALATPLNPPVIDPLANRGEPEILAPQELRVAAGYDVFQVKAAAGADGKVGENRLLAQPWAVVTGLVPVLKQQQEHDRVFRQAQAYDAKRDAPLYRAGRLERAEFDPANPEKLDWKEVDPAAKYQAQWGQASTGEFVSKRYLDEALTGGLGPLANTNQPWPEVVSHPKVPSESEEAARAAAAEAAAAQADKKLADENAAQARRVPQGQVQPAAAGARKPGDEPVEYKLLRVFDYSVEPGRKYRYRVTLALENPNYNQPPHLLKNPESARKQTLEGKPSEATSVVAIPTGHKVLAGKVDGGSRYAEPTATLLVTKIDRNEGLEAAAELEKVQRGGRANAAQRSVKVKNPLKGGTEEMTLDFQSNIVVLDIYGGRTLGRRRTEPILSPGEILVMDPDGNLTVRNDLDDEPQYESTVVREEPREKPGLKAEADAKRVRPGAGERIRPAPAPRREQPAPKSR